MGGALYGGVIFGGLVVGDGVSLGGGGFVTFWGCDRGDGGSGEVGGV